MSGDLLALAEREQRVLRALAGRGEESAFLNYRDLSLLAGLPNGPDLRLTVKGLAKRGLLRFSNGLITDNGELYGSGYSITDAGSASIEDAHPSSEPQS